MAMGRREKDIKLLVAKFIKLVESLNPGERLSIKKVASKKVPANKRARKIAPASQKKAKVRQPRANKQPRAS